MITLSNALKAVGGAHSGIDPVHLLDVLDVNGNAYYWSDRPVNAPSVLLSPSETPGTPGFPLTPPVALGAGQFGMWRYPTTAVIEGIASYHIDGSACSGTVGQEIKGPFSPPNRLTFSSFEPNALPAGAVVDASYLVTNYTFFPDAPYNDAGLGPASSGQASIGFPFPDGDAFFSYYDTVPGGPEPESCVINSIAAYVVYHFPSGGGSGSGSLPFGLSSGALAGPYKPWILSVPQITFHRSLQTDVGSFVLQNLSGDVLSRDFERIMRRSALEGAFFIYRLWDPSARASWMEMHGTLTVEGFGVDTVKLKGVQLLNPAAQDTPAEIFCENCQNQWGKPRCGSTQTTECKYSFQTCQVVERFRGFLNSYEVNYGEALANVATRPINRRRKI